MLYSAFAILLVAGLLAFSFWMRRRAPEHDRRYLADRALPLRAFTHGALATYRGNVGDPGYWQRADALAEMEQWSTPDVQELARLLEVYRSGEINLAFDKVRIIWLSRLGFACGWFDEGVSWRYVAEAVYALRAGYRGWEEVARDVELGAIQWNAEFSTPLDPDGLAWRRARADEARRLVWPYVPFQVSF
jgi:hypothetical protein